MHYSERYKDLFYHFDSWDDLKRIVHQEKKLIDYKDMKPKLIQFGLEDRQVQLNLMKNFLNTKIGLNL